MVSRLPIGYNPPLSSRPQAPKSETNAAMVAVLLTIHILVCVAMIGVILLQRSEGGGLGLGTGGGVGGLMTGRGAANALTRTTVIFAAIFISTSIALALVAKQRGPNVLAPANTGTTLPTTTLPGPATGTKLLPGAPPPPATDSAPPAQPQPSATPVPATPAPAPASGAQPAPQPATPPGNGN
jgi:preprotein translocase subunit SecG